MVQVVKMTDEEKFKMYMEVPHEELVRMKIEEEKVVEHLEEQLRYICSDLKCKYRNHTIILK